jgi:hypothetical protein
MDPLEKLRAYVASIKVGRVTDLRDLAEHLAGAWGRLNSRGAARVNGVDLVARLQQASWHPPVLRMVIGNHSGEPANPGDRWEINVENETVEPVNVPAAFPRPNFDMSGIVDQMVRAALERRRDPRLRWYSDGSVRIAVGEIFPEGVGFKQTVSSRRRKFRLALDERLRAAGWRRVKDYVYAPPAA